jgi:hypothetical protein
LASNNSYRPIKPQTVYRKYISFRKLAKQENCNWLPTSISTTQNINDWPNGASHLLSMETTADWPA